MSWIEAREPVCTGVEGDIDLIIAPKEKDIGDFSVRRVLPSAERRSVGPFVFFDHMGPAEFPPGRGIAVRPHPHIGLATLTYLFEGTIIHRDSLGVVQPIGPGAVNLMTAGRGIVHSERAGDDRDRVSRLHGLQTWMALPDGSEEIDPDFTHTPAEALPELDVDGVTVRVITGSAFGATSPVTFHVPMLYLELRMPAGARIVVPHSERELAAYVVEGGVRAGGRELPGGVMAIPAAGRDLVLEAPRGSHLVVVGGTPVGPRRLWWNFVARSQERIEQAKADWREGRFPPVPGDDEFIPLPS